MAEKRNPTVNNNSHTSPPPQKRPKNQNQSQQPIPAGHASLRMICHASHISAFIGKSGSSIKSLQLQTGSKIRVDDTLKPGSDHRVILIVAPSLPFKRLVDFPEDVSALQEAALRVYEKVVEVSGESAGTVLARVLIEGNQAGFVIGKGGKVVEKLRTDFGVKIRVLIGLDQLPSFVSPPFEVVEIEGDLSSVKKGLVGVCGRLQLCPQGDSSNKESKPVESTLQPTIHHFLVDPPIQRMPLYVTTTSLSPATITGPLSFEVDRRASLESKPNEQEVIFKILCPNERVGSIIGRGGSIIRVLQEETGAHINIGASVASCDERLVTVTSKEDVDARNSPAQNAVILIFTRAAEATAEKGPDSDSDKDSSVSARLLIPSNQVGCLLGKGGIIVSEMRKATGANIRILKGEQVPKCATEGDQVVEITGEFVKIQDALYQVTSRLRSHLFPSSMTSVSGSQTHILQALDASRVDRVRDMPIGVHHSYPTSQPIDRTSTMRQGLDSLYDHQRYDHSHLIGSRTSEVAQDASHHGRVRDLPIGVHHSSLTSQSVDGLSTMRHSFDSLYNHQRLDHSPLARPLTSDVPPDAIRHGRERDLYISGHHSFAASHSDGLSTMRQGFDPIYNRQRMDHSPLAGPRTSEVPIDATLHGRVRDLPMGVHQSFATSQSIDGLSSMRQGVESLYNSPRLQQPPLVGSRTPEVAIGVNTRSFINLGRGALANGGAELGSANRPAIVTNTTVEILVPEDAISSVYGENGRNINRIRQISGAKVEVREGPSGTRDRTVLLSGSPDETQAAQSLLHAFILTGSS